MKKLQLSTSSNWIPVLLLFLLVVVWAEVDLYAPGFTDMMYYFKTDEAHIQWTLSINFLGFFSSCLIVGPLSDSFGRRNILIMGTVIFIFGSVFCIFSESMEMFLLGRFIQGLGVSAPAVTAAAIITDVYQGAKQAKALSLINSMITIVMASAPIAGVFFTSNFGWRSNFWVMTLCSIIGVVLIFFFLPETLQKENRRPFSKDGLITGYVEVMTSKVFIACMLGLCLAVSSYWVFIGMIPLLFVDKLGMSLTTYGFYQGAIVSTFAFLSLIFPFILHKVNATKIARSSVYLSFLAALSLLVIAVLIPDNPHILTLFMCLYVIGLVFPNNLLFVKAMEGFSDLRGSASSAFLGGRMLITAMATSISGITYNGTFFSIACCAVGLIVLAMPLMLWMLQHPKPKPAG